MRLTKVIVVCGCALLVARPALVRIGSPTLTITLLFAALLAAAVVAPVRATAAPLDRHVVVVAALGIAVFALGRLLGGGHAPSALSTRFVALNSLAAVAEEALFRRVVYGVLEPAGTAIAIGGGALLFALVHLTVYGAWVLPIDLAAGVLFGWQRWASGSWSAPAATHVLANVLVVV